jgi:type I restriction enzyme, S subunit
MQIMVNNPNNASFNDVPLPSGWVVKTLGEVTIIKGEYGINAASVEYSTDLPTYLRITDIDNEGNFISEDKKSVDDVNSKKYFLDDKDIVFARTGATVGKTYLHDIGKNGELVFAGFLIRFRVKNKEVLPYYLKLYTDTKPYWDWVTTVSMRSGQPGINSVEFCSLKLPIPPLPEQKAIAQVLSTMDKVIQLTNQLIAKKEQRKKWLMQNLLTGKKRLRGYEKKAWKVKMLEEILIPISRPVNKPEINFLALGIRSHGKGTFLKNDFDPSKIEMETLFAVSENDLIVNITFAWEGAIAIVKKEDEGALVSHRFPTFTFNKEHGIVNFFRHLIKLLSNKKS